MKTLLLSSIAAILFTTSAVSAQRQWIVDARRGAGFDFATVAEAIDRASSGDRIIVRAGVYGPIRVVKALTLLGEPGAVIESSATAASFEVSAIPKTGAVVLRGFEFRSGTSSGFATRFAAITACRGQVVVANCSIASRAIFLAVPVQIDDSSAVLIHGCTISLACSVRKSRLTATSTKFAAAPSAQSIDLNGSIATLTQCTAAGGSIGQNRVTFPAIRCVSSHLTLHGDVASSYRGGTNRSSTSPALQGTSASHLIRDPDVTLSSPGFAGFDTAQAVEMPWFVPKNGRIGESLELVLGSSAGDAYFVFVGLVGTAIDIPSVGELWIDPGLVLFAAGGILGTSAIEQLDRPIPRDTSLIGVRLMYQALVGRGNRFRLSNAAPVILHGK